jgi:hypothetical protein
LLILDALFDDPFVLPLLLPGGLIALMVLFIDLAMLLFENPVSLLFTHAPLILPKAICLFFLEYS